MQAHQIGPRYCRVFILLSIFCMICSCLFSLGLGESKAGSFRHIVRQLNKLNSSSSALKEADCDWLMHYRIAKNNLRFCRTDDALNEAETIIDVARKQGCRISSQTDVQGQIYAFDACMHDLAYELILAPPQISRSFSDPPLFESVLYADQLKDEKLEKVEIAEELIRAGLRWEAEDKSQQARSQLNGLLKRCTMERNALRR